MMCNRGGGAMQESGAFTVKGWSLVRLLCGGLEVEAKAILIFLITLNWLYYLANTQFPTFIIIS